MKRAKEYEKAERRIKEAGRSATTYLDLSEMNLTELPESIRELRQLQVLNLSKNQLSSLPEWLSDCVDLQTLDVSQNKLTALPKSLGRLRRLESLELSENQLTVLPEWLGQLRKLSSLDLSNNKLVELPSSLGELTQLERLELSKNQLTRLPDSLGKLTQLGIVDLSDNRLTVIPTSFTQLRYLKSFRLDNNPLKLDLMPVYSQEKISFLKITLDLEIDQLTEGFLGEFCRTLANGLDVDVKNIVVLGFRPGSTQLLIAILEAFSALPDTINLVLRAFKLKKVEHSNTLQEASTFISYAHKDSHTVEAVYYFLEGQKMHPWLDKFELRGGQRWEEVLFEKIESSTGFVFCLSKYSKDRLKAGTILYKELKAARERALKLKSDESFLIPLNLDGSKIPRVIQQFQVLAWDKDKESLVQSLKEGLEISKRMHGHA